MKIAIVRGKYLNRYEMQYYEPLAKLHQLTAFSSLKPIHQRFAFPIVKLPSPMDLPDFPYKMSILNRLFVDAQYLFGLENRLAGFDIAHSAETYMHMTKQCLKAKKNGWVKKVIITVSENIPFANEGIWGRKTFKQQAIQQVDHFIAISELSKQVLITEGVDPDKISVLGHFVDTNKFKPSNINYQLTKNINLLFVGRLVWEKGIHDVMYSFHKLLHDKMLNSYNLTLTIVGKGVLDNWINREIKIYNLGKYVIRKNSSYEEMPAIFQSANILLLPSKITPHWQEQFGMVLLEGMACGLPIITTKTGAINETVGNNAFFVSPGNCYELAEIIKKLILFPKIRFQLGNLARKRSLIYDKRKGAKLLHQIYQNLISKQ